MTTTEATTTKWVCVTWDEDENAWVYASEPGQHADDEGMFDAEVPAALWDEQEAAYKAWRATNDRLVAATGYEDGKRAAGACEAWVGCETPRRSFVKIILSASGDENVWPVREVDITTRDTLVEAAALLSELPDEFHLWPGYGGALHIVKKDRLRVERFDGWAPTISTCYRCGWERADHAAASGESTDT